MRHSRTNKIFAIAGTGYGAGLIIRVSAGADYRRVADASGQFVCCTAGRSRRRQVAVLIQGDGADGAMSILVGDHNGLARAAGAMFFGSLNLLQSVPAFPREKILWVDQFDPICFRERFGTRAIEHNVWGFLHYEPCETDGISNMLQATNGTGSECLSVHDGRVHLVCAGTGENRATTGIEM